MELLQEYIKSYKPEVPNVKHLVTYEKTILYNETIWTREDQREIPLKKVPERFMTVWRNGIYLSENYDWIYDETDNKLILHYACLEGDHLIIGYETKEKKTSGVDVRLLLDGREIGQLQPLSYTDNRASDIYELGARVGI
jgi:hypothetical protein